MINKLLCFMWGHQFQFILRYYGFKMYGLPYPIIKQRNCKYCGKIK